MKKMIVAASVAATAALAPAFANAQEAAATGVYANLGYAYTDASDVQLGSIQAKLGYRFHPNFGIEGEGAFGIDDDRSAGAKIKLKHQFAAYAVGFVPLSENADLFARVGYGTTKVRASVAGVGASSSAESINLGAGGQFFFNANSGIRVEYLYSDYNDGAGHASTFGVAYSHRF